MGRRGPDRSHIESRRRAEQALELRARAYSYAEIADQLGFRHRDGARRAVLNLLAKTRRPTVAEQRAESAEELRVQRRRLHERQEAAEAEGDAETVIKAAREIRANLEAAAKLDGLNAPQRVEVEHTVDVTPTLAAAEWLRQVSAAAAQPAAALPGLPVIDAEVIDQ